MATAAAAAKGPKELTFSWEGKDKAGKTIRGEVRAASIAAVNATLRRQGIVVQKVKAVKRRRGGKVTDKDITLFTRQLATMMKAGVPLLQSFEIVSKGASNPAVAKLLTDRRGSRPAFWKAVSTAWRPTRKRSSPSSRRSRRRSSTRSRSSRSPSSSLR